LGQGCGPKLQPQPWSDTCKASIDPDLAKRWGKRFWQSCREKADRELGDPLLRLPIFSLLRLNMDNIFVDQALEAYRDETKDMRSWELLPVAVASRILGDAQRLKGVRSARLSHPAAADGCGDI
jgi:hypothetical protein